MGKAGIGGKGGTYYYDPENKEAEKQAYMKAWLMTSEEYDDMKAKVNAQVEESQKKFAEKYPALVDLVWAGDEMYYLIDGKRVEVQDRLEDIKEQIAASFNEVASDKCEVSIFNENEDGEITGSTHVATLSKQERVDMLLNQVDKDVKRA